MHNTLPPMRLELRIFDLESSTLPLSHCVHTLYSCTPYKDIWDRKSFLAHRIRSLHIKFSSIGLMVSEKTMMRLPAERSKDNLDLWHARI